MPFTREQLLAEAQRRGLQVPAAQPQFSRDQLLAEARRRGLSMPSAAPAQAPQDIQSDVPPMDPGAMAAWQAQDRTPQEDRGIGEAILGGAETALSTATGATGGAVGMVGGSILGVIEAIKQGKLGSAEGADLVERMAMQGAGSLTYAPRTEAGQEYTQELGQLTAPLQALGPVQGPRIPKGTLGKLTSRDKATPEAPSVASAMPQEELISTVKKSTPEAPSVASAMPQEELISTVKKSGGVGPGARKARKILAEQAAPSAEVVDAAKRLGIDEYLQPDHVTTNQQFREISQLVKSIPGSEARAAEIKGLAQVAKRADNIIDEMGGTEDWSTMSSDVKTRLQNIQGELDTQSSALYKQLSDAIPAKERVAADNLSSYLAGQIDDLGGEANLSPIEKSIKARITPKDGKPPTYALLDRTRRDLTAARVKNEGVFKDADTHTIKQLEKALLEDQKLVAEGFGLGDVFADARRTVAIRKGVEADMASLFGKQLDGSFITPLRAGVKKMAEGDVSRLTKTLDAIPEEMRPSVVATAMETAFGKSAKRGDISFANYSTWYENATKNKAAFNSVMKHLPTESRARLKDLYLISKGIRQSSREAMVTGRGESLRKALEDTDNLIKNVVSNASTMATSAAVDAVVPGAGIAMAVKNGLRPRKTNSAVAADKLLASPEFKDLVNDTVKNGAPSAQKTKKLGSSSTFKRYMKAIGAEGMAPDIWLLEAMKGDMDEFD